LQSEASSQIKAFLIRGRKAAVEKLKLK